jgi:hypothetical protein
MKAKFKVPTAKQKKWIMKGYTAGFGEALRLQHGMPAGVSFAKTWATKKRLALKIGEQHWQNSVKRALRGEPLKGYPRVRRYMGGASACQDFLRAVEQLYKPNPYLKLS